MFKKAILALATIAAVGTAAPSVSRAASDFTGLIGRIEVRTGHADPAVYRNGVVIRDASGGVVCAMQPGVENHDQFLSAATAAMLAGKSVTIARGGVLNGQFKCYWIQVVN